MADNGQVFYFSQFFTIEQEKDRQKEKVGDKDLEREIKNKGNIFLSEEQSENFVAAGTK